RSSGRPSPKESIPATRWGGTTPAWTTSSSWPSPSAARSTTSNASPRCSRREARLREVRPRPARGPSAETGSRDPGASGAAPARVTMAGYELTPVQTDRRGNIDVEDLRAKVNEATAGLMLTNPSTLGLFDENIEEITRIFHEAGALMYYDGANLNAVCGISRPGDMGFDVVHINLHKTFSQPHGGGGPGGGPIAVRKTLEPFLPVPVVVRESDGFRLEYDRPK